MTIEKLALESKNPVAERVEQMKALFPEIATDVDGGIDFEKLRLILGDEVDESDERYAFTWPGKSDAIRQAQTPSAATLRPCPEESVDWEDTQNLYIEGDNLEVLKLLQNGYHGKVKMIYIDPPYNTGSDFIYKDTFADSVENYKKQSGINGQSNADTSGRYHSSWCSMIYPRLKLARELLRQDGCIFISIDDNEFVNLKKICDEIFGENCYLNNFAWISNTTGRQISGKGAAKTWESVLAYCKDPNYASSFQVDVSFAKSKMPSMYKGFNKEVLHDERGEFVVGDTLYNHNRVFNEETRPNLVFSIFYNPETEEIRTGDIGQVIPGFVELLPHSNGDGVHKYHAWRWSKQKIANEYYDLIVVPTRSGGFEIYTRIRDFSNTLLKDVITDIGNGDAALRSLFNGKKVFDYPKSVDLLSAFVGSMDTSDGIILDFFSGSATLAETVIRENYDKAKANSYILVQLPEMLSKTSVASKMGFGTICEIAKERIRRVGAECARSVAIDNQQLKIGEQPKSLPDIGFRVLKLDESNFIEPAPMSLFDDVVKEDRSDQDLIFELMLKWGLELTLPIEKIECAGYPCYSVAADELICCMAQGLTIEALEVIAELEPRRVLMRDKYIDDTIKLNAELIFERVRERTQIEVDLRTV